MLKDTGVPAGPDIGQLVAAMPDDSADARRLTARFGDAHERLGFLLIRPEAVLQGFAAGILGRRSEHRLAVADRRRPERPRDNAGSGAKPCSRG
jgi:hypothetical protein